MTSGGNKQPTAAGCTGDCYSYLLHSPFVYGFSTGSSSGVVADWEYGNGVVTLLQFGTFVDADAGCTISFQFSDGTSGSFDVAAGSNTIPSYSLGGPVSFPPTITGISPGFGPWTGGTVVTITGTNLDTATAVRYSSSGAGWNFQIISSTEIRATSPAYGGYFASYLYVFTPADSAGSAIYFVLRPPSVAIATASLPPATTGVAYGPVTLGATGESNAALPGGLAYTWTATGLPSGIALSATGGILSGTPTQSGTFNVTLTATDNQYFESLCCTTVTKTLTLIVTPSVSVTTASLVSGTVGQSYTAPLAASGGTSPYTFAATGLPIGHAVSGSTIAGTPTQAGTFTVAVTATDATTPTAYVSQAQNLTLTIAQAAQRQMKVVVPLR